MAERNSRRDLGFAASESSMWQSSSEKMRESPAIESWICTCSFESSLMGW